MTTLGTLRDQLRRDLHDEEEASYRWTDAALDRHIERAVRELSFVLPREQRSTLQTSGSRDLSIESLTDLVVVEAVEYPAGLYPPSRVRFSVWGETLTLLVDRTPGVEDVDVYWGALHVIDDNGSTLPSYAEEALLLGAAGYAAVEWASFATNRANVSGTQAVEHYMAWGRLQLKRFEEQLGRFGRRGRVRAASLFTPAAVGGRSATQGP
jgi:hypothetical protein